MFTNLKLSLKIAKRTVYVLYHILFKLGQTYTILDELWQQMQIAHFITAAQWLKID